MKSITLSMVILCLLMPNICLSQTKTFIREYTYLAGEADCKLTSRAIALEQVKKLLLEEVSVYIQSSFEREQKEIIVDGKVVSCQDISKQNLKSITAGVTETKILEEQWTGNKYALKAKITIDLEEVKQHVAAVVGSEFEVKKLEESRRRAEQALAEGERIRQELGRNMEENQRLRDQIEKLKQNKATTEHIENLNREQQRIIEQYAATTKILSATNCYKCPYLNLQDVLEIFKASSKAA